MSTIKVLFNFSEDEDDENNFSASTFVSTAMLMVLNMFANDLKVPVEYLNRISFSHNVDIFINFLDEDGVYNSSNVEMIWPHYQNRYCLIYANTRILPPINALSFANVFFICGFMIYFINWIFFYLVIRYRMKKSFGEAFGLSFSYTNQSQMLMSIPMFRTTIHEKCFLTFKFFQNFFMASIYMSIFTTLLVSPQIKLVTDYEISLVKGYYPDPITNFGIGEPCLNELEQGLYQRRGCFLNCDVANKTVQEHEGVVFLREEINFQQMFKVSKESKHFDKIKKLVRRYFEAGMLDQIFNDIHATNYKFLEETGHGTQIKFVDIYESSHQFMLLCYCGSIIVFICEIVHFRWQQRNRLHQKVMKPIKRVRFIDSNP